MEELQGIHSSVRDGRVEDALLRRALNFSEFCPFPLFHSLRWRLLLRLLPANVDVDSYAQEWQACTRAHVDDWKAMNENMRRRLEDSAVNCVAPSERKRYSCESDSSSEDDVDKGVVENPLLPTAGSSYAFRFQVNALRSTAMKDIDRLHWDFPIFEEPTTKQSLSDILLNYCLRHDCEYIQGMHEIAAFILYWTHTDAAFLNNNNNAQILQEQEDTALLETFRNICPTDAVVALSFFIFEALMSSSGLRLYKWYFARDVDNATNIVGAAHVVQNEILAELDSSLCNRMNVVYDIQGPSYLIRWLRLLFLREFSFSQCAKLWDMFLSQRFLVGEGKFSLNRSIVTMFAASMLLYVKQDLMVGCVEALKRLMQYPPIENIGFLVEKTIEHLGTKGNDIRFYFTSPHCRKVRDLHLPATVQEQHGTPFLLAGRSPFEIMNQQGKKLTSIIAGLEKRWNLASNRPLKETERENEFWTCTIGELKKVRDVLLSCAKSGL